MSFSCQQSHWLPTAITARVGNSSEITEATFRSGGISLVQHEDSWKQTSNTAAARGALCPSPSPSPCCGDTHTDWLGAASSMKVCVDQTVRTPYRTWRGVKVVTGLHIILKITALEMMQERCHFPPSVYITTSLA